MENNAAAKQRLLYDMDLLEKRMQLALSSLDATRAWFDAQIMASFDDDKLARIQQEMLNQEREWLQLLL